MLQTGGETTVHAKDLSRNDGSDGKAVKGVDECFPDLDIASPLTLIVKPVHPCHVGTLMVAPQDEEIVGKFELVAQKKENGFQTLLAAIYIVAQEEIVSMRWEATHLKEPDQVVVLSMDIPHNLDWRIQLDERWLR